MSRILVPKFLTTSTVGDGGDGGTGTPGTHTFFDKFIERCGDGSINLSTVVVKCALTSDTVSSPPGGGPTATDPRWGAGGDQDVSSNEVSGGNYTAGGVAIDGTDPWALSGSQGQYTAQTASWNAGGSTPPTGIRYAVLYEDTTKYCISYVLLYDGDTPLSLETENLAIRWSNQVTSGIAFHLSS